MSRKDKIWIGGSISVTALVWGIVVLNGWAHRGLPRENPATWNQSSISAAYVSSQLKEIDKTHCSLILSYDVTNSSSSDYRLTEGPGVVILSRLKTDGSLSQEQPLRLRYPMFLPPGQRARLAIEISQPFAWPPESDPAYLDKLREFVKHNLDNVAEFVVFDESSHRQLQLPSAWGELSDTSTAGF